MSRQKLFCKTLWQGQLNSTDNKQHDELNLIKVQNKLDKAKAKNKLITLRMVGYWNENDVKKEISSSIQQHCCSMRLHSIIFVVSLAFTIIAVVLRFYR